MRLQTDRWWRGKHILVDIARQSLELCDGPRRSAEFAVSTGINGVGEQRDSGCTPCGLHRVRIRIGAGCPRGTVFRGRRPTGEIYDALLGAAHPGRDWILTRILWLTGCQSGRNRGGEVDTLRRFIYIHGCPESEPMGVPRSHGCIRMHCDPLIELFDRVEDRTPVMLVDRRRAPHDDADVLGRRQSVA
jgi:hypothetical protein